MLKDKLNILLIFPVSLVRTLGIKYPRTASCVLKDTRTSQLLTNWGHLPIHHLIFSINPLRKIIFLEEQAENPRNAMCEMAIVALLWGMLLIIIIVMSVK